MEQVGSVGVEVSADLTEKDGNGVKVGVGPASFYYYQLNFLNEQNRYFPVALVTQT